MTDGSGWGPCRTACMPRLDGAHRLDGVGGVAGTVVRGETFDFLPKWLAVGTVLHPGEHGQPAEVGAGVPDFVR